MRLGTFLLTGLALASQVLAAQGRAPLPWERIQPVAWQAGTSGMPAQPSFTELPSSGPVKARVSGDGTLLVLDGRGIIRLRAGLPGRPLKAWRDGGIPLATPSGTWNFPKDTPLTLGLGGLRWAAEDFRPFLRGLLWILEDGEGFLALVHPATAKVVYLPLPPGRELQVHFLADRLEVAVGDADSGSPACWSIPWIGLLPRLAALCPQPDPAKPGSALSPFPKD